MPIVVEHQPSAYGIGQAAFQAGLGQFRKQQQELALRNTALALQAMQQQQGYQLAQQRNAMDAAQLQSQNARFGMQMDQEARLRQQQMDVQQQWRNDQVQQQRDATAAQAERQQYEWDQRNALDEKNFEQQQTLFGQQQAAQFEHEASRNQWDLNAPGMKIQQEIDRQFAAVDSMLVNREIDDETAQEAKQMITATAGKVDWSRHIRQKQQPTAQEWADQNIITLPDGTQAQLATRNGQQKLEPLKLGVDRNKMVAEGNRAWKNAVDAHAKWFQAGATILDGTPMKQMWLDRLQKLEPKDESFYVKKAFAEAKAMGEKGEGEAPPEPIPQMNAMQGSHPQGQPQFDQQTAARIPSLQQLQQGAQSAPPEVRDALALIAEAVQQFPTAESRQSMPPGDAQLLAQSIQLVQRWRQNGGGVMKDMLLRRGTPEWNEQPQFIPNHVPGTEQMQFLGAGGQ